MRHHLVRSAAVAVSLTVTAAVCAAAGTAGPLGAAAASVATTTAGTLGPARPVFLINGGQVGMAVPRAPGVCIFTFDFGPRAGTTGQLQTLRVGGTTYVIPIAAEAYLGRGLDPSLFDMDAVAAAESGGQLPVQVDYTGHLPALPGVTITGSGRGAATGYLTAAGATKFGAALTRQFTADHARGSYGQDGLFAHGVSIALAGAPTAAPAPKYAMRTLTVTGTNLAGKPDSGDIVWLFNADNAAKFDNLGEAQSVFYHGVAKFSVPAGHYWAIGEFVKFGRQGFDEHMAVLPEFTVGKDTTVNVDAQAASSKIQMVTPRPAGEADVGFSLIRTGAAGPIVSLSWLSASGGPKAPAAGLYVSPTQASPATGTLTSITNGQLDSPSKAPGVPYEYDLAYQSHGIIPAQRFAVNQASLATEDARFYSAGASTGIIGRLPVFPIQYRTCYGGSLFRISLPARQTVYLSASPSLSWRESYSQSSKEFGSGGQLGAPRAFLPGERVTENWGAYPLHPAPDVKLVQVSGGPLVPVSASRAGDTLRLDMTAFSDSVPGHTGGGVYPPFKAAGSYEIDQNGTKIAGGTVARFSGLFTPTATLSSSPSLIGLTLTAAEPGKLNPLSTASQTVWTWQSAGETGSTLPPGWTCLPDGLPDRACAVQPMMTLRYGVVGLGLDGSAGAGQQVVRVSVGHLQLAAAAKVTAAAVAVSFDGGKSWQEASTSGSGGSYAAVFSAPAGALVSLRTSAVDAAGGSVTETITNAYQVAS